jgi:DNA-binding Xre family transcriptional regulator
MNNKIDGLILTLSKGEDIGYLYTLKNVIKKTSFVLNMTYDELGKELSISGNTLNKLASTNNISEIHLKVIELYLENIVLKREKDEILLMQKLIKKFLS